MKKELIYKSNITSPNTGKPFLVKLIEKQSVCALQEGILDAVIVYDIEEKKYIAISNILFKEQFTLVKEPENEEKENVSVDQDLEYLKDLANILDDLINKLD